MIDTVEKFVKAVEYMRDCQKSFKKSYSESEKKKLVESEKIVDLAIAEHNRKKNEKMLNQQANLF